MTSSLRDTLLLFLLVSLLPATALAQGGPASRLGSPDGPSADVPPDVRYPIPSPGGVGLPVPGEEPDVRIPSRIITRIRALDASLSILGARSGSHIVNGILSAVIGGATITIAAVMDTSASYNMRPYLYLLGAVAIVRGGLDLFLTPNAAGAAVVFRGMPMHNAEDVQARLDYGESALSEVATRAMVARLADGGLSLVGGLSAIPAYAANGGLDFEQAPAWFILVAASVSAVVGIVTLASTSAAERRWNDYVRLRDRLESEENDEAARDPQAALEHLERSAAPGVEARFGVGAFQMTF